MTQIKAAIIQAVLVSAMALFSWSAHAQVDRAYDSGAIDDFDEYSNSMIDYAEDGNRDKALEQAEQMHKSIEAIHTFIKDAPRTLDSADLNDLEGYANTAFSKLADVSVAEAQLVDKLKRTQESFSSELSTFKSKRQDFGAAMGSLMQGLQARGKLVRKQYDAIKAVCTRGCLD